MNYPLTIRNLIESFKKLPGIGEKTAERLALSIFELDDDIIEMFSKSLKDIKTKIKRCEICSNYSEKNLCEICLSDSRDKKTICIVEEPKNIILFEKMGSYNGSYHVLGGLISPLAGIGPGDINLASLINRIKQDDIDEVILAIKPTVEGETTSLYIAKFLKDFDVDISKIAHGIPLGAEMEYIDSLTLEFALEDRRKISLKEE